MRGNIATRSMSGPPFALQLHRTTVWCRATEAALLARIEQVMGKPIARGVTVPIVDDMPQDYQEDEEDEHEQ